MPTRGSDSQARDVTMGMLPSADVLFTEGTWAEFMYVTIHGRYKLSSSISPEMASAGEGEGCGWFDDVFTDSRWFADLCLLTPLLHECMKPSL